MPYSGSGVFSPLITFANDTTATAEDQNSQDSDIAGGLTQAMTRAGLAAATANIPMGGFKFTGLGMGSSSGDSVNFGQLSAFAPLAGATFTGAVSFGSTISVTGAATFAAAAFSGATTVPTVATNDNYDQVRPTTANVTAKIACASGEDASRYDRLTTDRYGGDLHDADPGDPIPKLPICWAAGLAGAGVENLPLASARRARPRRLGLQLSRPMAKRGDASASRYRPSRRQLRGNGHGRRHQYFRRVGRFQLPAFMNLGRVKRHGRAICVMGRRVHWGLGAASGAIRQ